MKKVFLMIITFVFFAQICCADSFQLTVDNKTADVGETVTIELNLSDNPGIIAALFELEYDKDRLRLIKAEDKGILKGPVFSQTYEKYPYTMLWNSSSATDFKENGCLAELTFKVLDNAKNGDAFIKLSYLPDNVYNAELENVKLNISNGFITVTGGVSENVPTVSSGTSSGVSRPPVVKEPEPVKPTISFTDVKPSDWYYKAVNYVVEKGLMKGTTDTDFSPDIPLTRGMLVTVLYRNEGSPQTDKINSFSDVPDNMYYKDAIVWAKENEIVSGITETKFAPENNITREQLVTILYRFAKHKEFDTSKALTLTSYEDYKDISPYATDAIEYAVGAGLIKGTSANTINPTANATRAETATILQRLFEHK